MDDLVWRREQGRVLDFDLETIAAGFADPEWVPQKITCAAWSWVDSDEVECLVATPAGIWKPDLRRKMLEPLCAAIRGADMLTGHNILRFDLKVLQTECMRLGLPNLPAVKVQDTIRLVKTKGFKKGQDNMAKLVGTDHQKKAMDWQDWEDAYEEAGWQGIKERAVNDVRQHKELRLRLLELGWLKPPVSWAP